MPAKMQDVAELRLRLLGDEAEKSLESLNAGAKQLKNNLALLETQGKKNTAEYAEMKVLQRDINAELRKQKKAVDINNASYNELIGYRRELNKELKKAKIGSDEWVAALKKIEPVNQKIKDASGAMRGVKDEAQKSKGVWSNVKQWIVGAFAVQAILNFGKQLVAFGKQVFDITSRFETYGTVLSNTLNGQEEAAVAMEMIKDIAASTPISVDEMTGSFIKMVNRGLKPTGDEIKNLADLASSQGKSFDQLTEAVLDAMMGEGERLKEFGIKMRKSGDDISLMFKNQTVTVKNNEKAIADAIIAMGDYNGVAGMTSEISQTLEGRVSNLGDAWDFVQLKLGKYLRPVFVAILDLFAKGVEWVSELLDANTGLGTYYGIIVDILKQVYGIFSSLFKGLLPDGVSNTITFANVLKMATAVMGTLLLGIKAVVSSVQVMIDGFMVLADAGKTAFYALKGDFAEAAKSAMSTQKSWDRLKNNAKTNFTSIGDTFAKLWDRSAKKTEIAAETVDMYGKLSTETAEKTTKVTEKELAKQQKARDKAAAEDKKRLEKLDKMYADSIEDETDRHIVMLMQKYEADVDYLDQNLKDEEEHKAALKKLTEKLIADIEDLENKEEQRKKKLQEEKEKRIKQFNEKVIDWEFNAQKKILENAIDAAEEGSDRRLMLQKQLQDLLLKMELERIKRWEEKELAATNLTEDQKTAIKRAADREREIAHQQHESNVDKINSQMVNNHRKAFDHIAQAWKTLMGKNANATKEQTQAALQEVVNFGTAASNAFTSLLDGNAASFYSSMSEMAGGMETQLGSALGTAGQVAAAIGEIIDGLVKAYGDWTEYKLLQSQNITNDEIAQINARKEFQIQRWTEMYESGVISKEEYDAKMLSLENQATEAIKAEQLKLWHEQKERNIRMAKIEAMGAYIKSLATLGILGLPRAIMAMNLANEKIKLMESEQPPAELLPSGGGGAGGGAFDSAQADSPAPGDRSSDGSEFASGGMIPSGPSHNEGGISLWNNRTGRYVGEIEGGEPILSKMTYRNNKALVDRLLHSSLHKNGASIYKNGGFVNTLNGNSTGYWQRGGRLTDMADYSGLDGEARGVMYRSLDAMDNMVEFDSQTAKGIAAVVKILTDSNSLLAAIRDKPSGVSLHDIMYAMREREDLNKKSEF